MDAMRVGIGDLSSEDVFRERGGHGVDVGVRGGEGGARGWEVEGGFTTQVEGEGRRWACKLCTVWGMGGV